MQINVKDLTKIAFLIAVVIIGSVILFGNPNFSVIAALIFVGFPILLYAVLFLIGFFSVAFGMEIISDDSDNDRIILDEDLKIKEYGNIIGKLDGHDVYDFIIVELPGSFSLLRLEYQGPVSLNNGFDVERNVWFVILNDVLYLDPKKVEKAESV